MRFKVKPFLKRFCVALLWGIICSCIITPRIFMRIEYKLTHRGVEPYMTPILDWPQYVILSFSVLLMGILINDFLSFLLMYFLAVIVSCYLSYVMVCSPIYLNILTTEYYMYHFLPNYALMIIAKTWVIVPLVVFLFLGIVGVFLGELIRE